MDEMIDKGSELYATAKVKGSELYAAAKDKGAELYASAIDKKDDLADRFGKKADAAKAEVPEEADNTEVTE